MIILLVSKPEVVVENGRVAGVGLTLTVLVSKTVVATVVNPLDSASIMANVRANDV